MSMRELVPGRDRKRVLRSKCVCGRPTGEGLFQEMGSAWVQCCPPCFVIEAAELEADENAWRWTPIGTGIPGCACYCGDRCPCGAVRHANLDLCIRCWRDYRMLGKQEADTKFNRRVINQIKEALRHGNKN